MANYQPDSVYFKQRAEQEALAASEATTAKARDAHNVIARRYFELGQALEIYDSEPEPEPVSEKVKAQVHAAACRYGIARTPLYVRSLNLKHDRDRPSPGE